MRQTSPMLIARHPASRRRRGDHKPGFVYQLESPSRLKDYTQKHSTNNTSNSFVTSLVTNNQRQTKTPSYARAPSIRVPKYRYAFLKQYLPGSATKKPRHSTEHRAHTATRHGRLDVFFAPAKVPANAPGKGFSACYPVWQSERCHLQGSRSQADHRRHRRHLASDWPEEG